MSSDDPAVAAGSPIAETVLVLGTATTYACRVLDPLPERPHPPLVSELRFDGRGYADARARWGTSAVITLRTRPGTAGSTTPEALVRHRVDAELFLGTAGRDGTSLGTVGVEVCRVLVFDPPTGPGPPDGLRYALFGGEPDLYLARYPAGPADFQQILRVQRTTLSFEPLPPPTPAIVVVPDRRPDLVSRLVPGEQITIGDPAARRLGITADTPLQILAEVYLDGDPRS